jgi:hypothetical protein
VAHQPFESGAKSKIGEAYRAKGIQPVRAEVERIAIDQHDAQKQRRKRNPIAVEVPQ